MKDYRKRYLGLGWALILFGVFIAVTTYYTLVGIFFGLMLVGIGAFIIWSMRHPTSTAQQPPPPAQTPPDE